MFFECCKLSYMNFLIDFYSILFFILFILHLELNQGGIAQLFWFIINLSFTLDACSPKNKNGGTIFYFELNFKIV